MPQETYEAYHNVGDNYGRAIKLEFRFKNGNSEQFEYSYLVRTSVRLSAGKIIMKYMDAVVTIEGFKLKRLVDDLRNNKVEWIRGKPKLNLITPTQARFL